MLKIVLEYFITAAVIVVGGSPMLSEVAIEAITGHGDNEVVRASWSDGENCEFAVVFTEEGLANGRWDESGSFFAEDAEGDEVEVSFFELVKKSYVSSPAGEAA